MFGDPSVGVSDNTPLQCMRTGRNAKQITCRRYAISHEVEGLNNLLRREERSSGII